MNRPWQIINDPNDLPAFDGVREVFLDVETRSGDPKRGGLKPYHGDNCCGVAFTFDNEPMAYYIPMRYGGATSLFESGIKMMPIDVAVDYFRRLLRSGAGRIWINHNIRFDAHVMWNEGIDPTIDLIDTLPMAQVVDGQSKQYGYGLKELCKNWLGETMEDVDAKNAEMKRLKTKDFGDIDPAIVGEYACGDVQRNRNLWYAIQRKRYEGDERVWDLEIETTRTLFEMERRGIRIDTEALLAAKRVAMTEMETIRHRIETLGFIVEINSDQKLIRYILDVIGLPVVGWTNKRKPSIDAAAIAAYQSEAAVVASEELTEFFSLLSTYKSRSMFVSLYANGWKDWVAPDGLIHCSYRQILTTGRMACTGPNMQQLSPEAKQFVIPSEGNAFMRRDYSQVEYRIITSLSRDEKLIAAYNDDPSTDFHVHVAEICGIERKPAKTINFGIAFGMGEKGIAKGLSTIQEAGKPRITTERAVEILATYNGKFPKVRKTSRWARKQVRDRAGWKDGGWGFIKTLFGRRRMLQYWQYRDKDNFDPKKIDDSRLAFNTAVQGTAADIMKDRANALDRDPVLKSAGVGLRAIVHDEALLEGPSDAIADTAIQARVEAIMCDIPIDLGLPLMVDGNESEKNWGDAE